MRLKKITNNKIKIYFTFEDMNSCHISKDLLFSDNYIAQNLLQLFLEKAEKELNFTVNEENLIVEVISLNNGFVFTITRIVSDSNFDSNTYVFYKFENFNNFIAFCTYIKNMNWSVFQNFQLYIYNDSFYLVTDYNLSKEFHMVLSEFGVRYKYSQRFLWIFKRIWKNAF